MNVHKKLKELGFRKTRFFKPGHEPDTYDPCMVSDDFETKVEYTGNKRVETKVPKLHPKSDSFWILKYNENISLYCLVKNHQINKIWIENKLGKSKKRSYWGKVDDCERLKLIFDLSNRETYPIGGKDQIMSLLPTAVRRNFLLDQLFG